MIRSRFFKSPVVLITAVIGVVYLGGVLSGCSSGATKRKEEREKAVQTSKLYCEFVNGENFPDIDVALNLAMAQKCDHEEPHSLTAYRTPSEVTGVMFCCSVVDKNAEKANGGGKDKSARGSDRTSGGLRPVPPTVAPPQGGAPGGTPATAPTSGGAAAGGSTGASSPSSAGASHVNSVTSPATTQPTTTAPQPAPQPATTTVSPDLDP
jgi:hypothetical protein